MENTKNACRRLDTQSRSIRSALLLVLLTHFDSVECITYLASFAVVHKVRHAIFPFPPGRGTRDVTNSRNGCIGDYYTVTVRPLRLLHFLRFVGSSFKRKIFAAAVFCVEEFAKHP